MEVVGWGFVDGLESDWDAWIELFGRFTMIVVAWLWFCALCRGMGCGVYDVYMPLV